MDSFPNVKGSDATGEEPGMFAPTYTLAANPGEYEFKLLWNNGEVIKFTVAPDGKFDNAIAQSRYRRW